MDRRVAIVTDSTSDIEPAKAKALGITVVPLFVVFGDRSYKDYVELTRPEFYRKLHSEPVLPITSQPTAAMYEEAFAPLVEAGNDVLCLAISSKLSGTMNAASAAAQHFPGARIEIYDSQTVAGGLGMMVLHARELAAGGASLDQIVGELDRWRRTERLYACLADLSHVQRTGRIGKAQAVLGTLMKIVPVLSLKDGQVAAEAQVRTFARAQETMLDLVLAAAPNPAAARFLVMHTNAPHLAEQAAEKLRARLGGIVPQMLEIWEAGPVIATHGGPGAVGVFVAQG
ncbi:MAG TPA: DegV family protein [Candidatus Baltobacteraceae bacterium]|nr:DegV family protein [Candidatus Baltobacteraceae bacterium]